ncbi:MAG: LysE family translocator [Pseudomonadota bacterium]
MTADVYFAYLVVVGVFFATPPDTSQLLLMSNSATHGLRRSLATAAGDLSANVLQMTAAGFGLTAIIASSAEALTYVKWAGAAYLAWIGLKLFLSKAGAEPSAPRSRLGAGALFRQGFLTSAANPYAVIFFAALFPQFIDPSAALAPQLVILGATYLVVDGATLIAWGWAAERGAERLRRFGGATVNRVSGALMIAAAALLASKDITETQGAPR